MTAWERREEEAEAATKVNRDELRAGHNESHFAKALLFVLAANAGTNAKNDLVELR
ncbi:MAG TPA: hypothetical protein VL793_05225 [Patescibacteria group bacterium]|nr:hypothetical protein [Patescibacteria group bacterium]